MHRHNENYVNRPNCVHLCSFPVEYSCDCARNNVTGRYLYAPGTSARARAQLYTVGVACIVSIERAEAPT